MIINSVLPPVCIQSVVNNQWYIVTTDPKLGWVPVDRKYEWEELDKMWHRVIHNVSKKAEANRIKATYKVNGSKGNVYKIVNDGGVWTCSCPAHGFGRGKDCKHIIGIKNK